MIPPQLNLWLADDDMDDCIFFKEALEELQVKANLTSIFDGVELMHQLYKDGANIPDVIYLDLNMPRKNGFECLSEIKANEQFMQIPIIIFSTSYDADVVSNLHECGANYYMRKPGEFSHLKKIIHKSLLLISSSDKSQTPKDKFVINPI